ncbi:uncharacterized protein BYT42DRAFT_611758 [Radiomyces spectabilis]|uniref:uncharacterized protein n=1 Tax=Radiomyces spectabilis TaxID=64574 RepID=UPI00221FA1BA|nr:uncharacterized protein BYT42DRAFT_611758 [Radiomyces spectabilis]KAI8388754.1 hypothetical protein BYT42DRAFT_611758 [Radiomyces spectabilis]
MVIKKLFVKVQDKLHNEKGRHDDETSATKSPLSKRQSKTLPKARPEPAAKHPSQGSGARSIHQVSSNTLQQPTPHRYAEKKSHSSILDSKHEPELNSRQTNPFLTETTETTTNVTNDVRVPDVVTLLRTPQPSSLHEPSFEKDDYAQYEPMLGSFLQQRPASSPLNTSQSHHDIFKTMSSDNEKRRHSYGSSFDRASDHHRGPSSASIVQADAYPRQSNATSSESRPSKGESASSIEVLSSVTLSPSDTRKSSFIDPALQKGHDEIVNSPGPTIINTNIPLVAQTISETADEDDGNNAPERRPDQSERVLSQDSFITASTADTTNKKDDTMDSSSSPVNREMKRLYLENGELQRRIKALEEQVRVLEDTSTATANTLIKENERLAEKVATLEAEKLEMKSRMTEEKQILEQQISFLKKSQQESVEQHSLPSPRTSSSLTSSASSPSSETVVTDLQDELLRTHTRAQLGLIEYLEGEDDIGAAMARFKNQLEMDAEGKVKCAGKRDTLFDNSMYSSSTSLSDAITDDPPPMRSDNSVSVHYQF